MIKKALMTLVLFILQIIIANLAALGTIAGLCLLSDQFIFMAWDYPLWSMVIIATIYCMFIRLYGDGQRWLALYDIRKITKEIERDRKCRSKKT